ncbi:MAG: hypothetical protein GY794_16245 [bacterium]|nr:hypothetical protein [bacterium]
MSKELNIAVQDYVAAFDDQPTIIGMTDETAVRAINKAVRDKQPIEEPTDPNGEVDIYV